MAAGKKRSKILVVDSDESVRASFKRILENAGYEVDVAEDKCEALQKAKTDRFDVALIDKALPDNNVFEFSRLLEEVKLEMVKIIVTSMPSEHEENEARESGCSYLVKPVALPDLLDVIKTSLEKKT